MVSDQPPVPHLPNVPSALSIAGSDPSGGAGIQADLKVFSAFGVYGGAAITALTAQNTRNVTGVQAVPPEFVQAQLEALAADLRFHAIKVGMVANASIAAVVADWLSELALEDPPPAIVVDPVMVSKGGDALVEAEAVAAIRNHLLPLASVITPNRHEAARLLGEADCAGIDRGDGGRGTIARVADLGGDSSEGRRSCGRRGWRVRRRSERRDDRGRARRPRRGAAAGVASHRHAASARLGVCALVRDRGGACPRRSVRSGDRRSPRLCGAFARVGLESLRGTRQGSAGPSPCDPRGVRAGRAPMAAPWFHLDPLPESGVVWLPKDEAKHATGARRLGEGDAVVLFDGRGTIAHATLLGTRDRRGDVEARIDSIERHEPKRAAGRAGDGATQG